MLISNNILKPSFFIVGAQKAGTTSLHNILKNHPEIFLPKKKESRFFNFHYSKGLKWYLEKNFIIEPESTYKISGEVDPSYLINSLALKRMKNDLGGNLKIIIIIRNPIHRAYSAYNMFKRIGSKRFSKIKNLKFSDVLKKEFNNHLDFGLLKNSNYLDHIIDYENKFGKNNVKILIFEKFISHNQHEIVDDICEFLGVSKLKEYSLSVSNKGNLPRLKFMYFIYSSNYFFKILRNFISKIPLLKKIIKALFTKKIKKLDSSILHNLSEKYFKIEISKLENHLGYKIEEWM